MIPTHAAKAPHNLVLESELLFIRDLLASSDGIAAMTSAPPPYDKKPFPNGGKWRGLIPQSLVRKRLISRVGAEENRSLSSPAIRPSRNRTVVLLWKTCNRHGLHQRETELLSQRNRPAERTLFDELP